MIKDILRLSSILIIVCALSTALVSGAFSLTLPLIEARQTATISATYKQVLPQAGELIDAEINGKNLVSVKRSIDKGQTNGYIYTVNPDGYGGQILIMLGIEYPSARLSGVKILQQNETPGLGAKCTEPAFLQQFIAKDLREELVVSKQAAKPQEIQAITASTITSAAVVKGINSARAHYRQYFADVNN